ncbi:hypothetical protein [Aureimonas sp. Leaf454]|uniref:hypothetical protein n=1 Tax=Aureimonas sp. Leaf454 TaxID=1736381 RepID=UPI000AA49C25|nr:hypothetical protein [Aureimonas sp. Leaf454]
MAREDRHRSSGWVIGIIAVIVAILLLGLFTEGFGLYGTEIAPGTTTPPNAPG